MCVYNVMCMHMGVYAFGIWVYAEVCELCACIGKLCVSVWVCMHMGLCVCM